MSWLWSWLVHIFLMKMLRIARTVILLWTRLRILMSHKTWPYFDNYNWKVQLNSVKLVYLLCILYRKMFLTKRQWHRFPNKVSQREKFSSVYRTKAGLIFKRHPITPYNRWCQTLQIKKFVPQIMILLRTWFICRLIFSEALPIIHLTMSSITEKMWWFS